jgi:hypothetical protein
MPLLDSHTNHFLGILLTIVLAATHERAGRAGSIWLILYALPGTLLHELAHFIVALVTGGRPRGFSIMPRRGDCLLPDGTCRKTWVLGSVSLGNPGMFSAVPTAIAPMGLIFIAWFIYRRWYTWFPADSLHTLLLYLTVYLFCYSSIPSKQDIKVACSSLPGLMFYGGLAAGLCVYFLG